ncbi:MAG: hypothetical protein A2785_02725 [Candidatus Chisholmbacteria bacterium RIFCSPHIGHO2_01_FULL_49_18]|uniref:YYY membrane protein n=1 Tax=Candidatus Chisholmbacteria bacterium RIFCSPHIGHO2_01_FULL_49_18 TaxID=1797590 RepID=A0A1G1VKY0_9BACT|nr:MAG: hypothetical protein A2785_02725 [Candidatus Chisholmbacteria bacterium RIFCSPHIGHO2_01_FULL_49_18]
MFIQDLPQIIRWWMLFAGLGLLAFSIIHLLLSRFWDGGWAFAKIFGLALISYWVFLFGNLRLIPFGSLSIWLGVLVLVVLSLYLYRSRKMQIIPFFRRRWRWVLLEEALFFLGLLFWSWVRGHQPAINGLEKFMDFGFVNSILRSGYLPPSDMWLSGETINYYYFGHLMTAVITRLSGLSSAVTYNLMIATILGLVLSATFSLATTLAYSLLAEPRSRSRQLLMAISGIVSAVVMVFAGNLHTVVTAASKGAANYWYPDATRYIPFTIHEFPLYSFVVADLHGHVNNIPFVLLTLAFLFAFLLEYKYLQRFSFFNPTLSGRILTLGLLVGILYMTNALDAPIYLTVMALALLFVALSERPILQHLKRLFTSLILIIVCAFLFSLPFHLTFVPFSKGIALVRMHSHLIQLLVLWGFFISVGITFFLLLLFTHRRVFPRQVHFNALIARFLLALVVISTFLVILPELFYIKDIYIAEYHRANTMFKLVYQTFILMSLSSGPVLVFLLRSFNGAGRKLRYGLAFLLLVYSLGLGSILMYPYFSIRSYYNRLERYQGLNGLTWMQDKYPDDQAAVAWLQLHLVGQPVIAEAVGESYTDFARISANTGLPTILGWRVHEWLWRGSFDELSIRTNDVAHLYTSADLRETCSLVERYNISYIFVGTLERQQYASIQEWVFQALGEKIFSQGETTIYRIRRPCAGVGSPSSSVPGHS